MYDNQTSLNLKGEDMKKLILGNIEFNVELVLGSPVGQLLIMGSAMCLETGQVYNKEQANKYYRLYSA